MRWSVAFWAPLLALALLSAGCISVPCTRGPLVSARGIGSSTASEGGSGDFLLDVRIEDPAGSPIAGAGVVAYWGDATPQEYREEMRRAEAGQSGVRVEPGRTAGTPGARHALRLLTDGDGHARAHVPSGRLVGLVAAAPGWTEEWIGWVATGDSGSSSTQGLRLFPSRIDVTLNVTWSPGAASTGTVTGGGYAWRPQDVPFSGDAAGHMRRLVSLSATVEWTNAPTAFGDLAIGLGSGSELRAVGDERVDAEMGSRTETRELDLATLREYGFHEAAGLEAGPATGSALVAPLGLPATVHVVAELDRAGADLENCLFVVWGETEDTQRRDQGPVGASVDPEPVPVVEDAVGAPAEDGARASPAPLVAFVLAVVGAALAVRRRT